MAEDAINIIRSRNSKLVGEMEPEIATGRARTMQILKMLLPTMFPTKRSLSPFLAAVTVVTNSGREVPSATIVKETMRSEMPMAVAIVEAELTTSSLPKTIPTRPIRTKRKDFPSFHFGFSTSLASFLFLRASEMR